MSNESKFIPNFLQVPNVVIDELLPDLTGAELKCYLVVIRKTKGWNKESDNISISQFMKATGLSNSAVIKACESLVQYGLLVKENGARNTGVYAVNSYSKITHEKSSQVTCEESSPVKKVHITCEKSSQVTCEESSHTINNIKNTIQNTNTNLTVSNTNAKKTKIEKINPERLDGLLFEDETLQAHGIAFIDRVKWSAYCEMRRAKGKGAEIKTKGTLEAVLKKLLNLSGGNYELANAILEQSIGNTWTGLFALKAPIQHSTNSHSANDPFADNGTWGIGRKLRVNPNLIPEELR